MGVLHPSWHPSDLRKTVEEEFAFADRDGDNNLDLIEFIALYNKLKVNELNIDEFMG